MAKKDGVFFNTVGWEKASHEMLVLPHNLETKYAKAFTAEVARQLKAEMKSRLKSIGNKTRSTRGPTGWPKDLWRMPKMKPLSGKAKSKHGDIGHRVGLMGKIWAARGAWLERGHVTANGGRTRAYPWVLPSRNKIEPKIPSIGKKGIAKKLERDAKRAAKKIAASKKP